MTLACCTAHVSPSPLYDWRARHTHQPADKEPIDAALVPVIRYLHAKARTSIFAWIARYNHRRLYSTLSYLPPIEWEDNNPCAPAARCGAHRLLCRITTIPRPTGTTGASFGDPAQTRHSRTLQPTGSSSNLDPEFNLQQPAFATSQNACQSNPT